MYRQTSELSLRFNLSDIHSIAPLVSEEIKEALFLSREARVLQSRGMKNEPLLCRELPGEKNGKLILPGQAAQLSLQVRLPRDASRCY